MRIISDIQYAPVNNYSKPKVQKSNSEIQTYSTESIQKVDYSKIAFGAIYNVKNKKIDLVFEQSKLLRQIRELLVTDSGDIDPVDMVMGMIDRAIKIFKSKNAKKIELTQKLQDVIDDKTLNPQQKFEQANVLKKQFNLVQKRKLVPKTEKPKVKPDEGNLDYSLLNRFKAAVEQGDFNLRKVWDNYYAGLNQVKTIGELNKKYPKIKTPARPEDVIASKFVNSLTRDFFEDLEKAFDAGSNDVPAAFLEKKVMELLLSISNTYKVDPADFAEKLVSSVTNKILDKYESIQIGTSSYSSIPTARKMTKPIVSELDMKLLQCDFDDFVLQTIKKHYLDGEKLNNIIYSDGSVNIKLSSLKGSEYKFEKSPEKIKNVIKDASDLFTAQRDYRRYDTDEFRTRLAHFAETEIAEDETVLQRIIDFDNCNYTEEDVNQLIKFFNELDDISDGKITLEQGTHNIRENGYRPKGTEKLNELERRKVEEQIRLEQKKAIRLRSLKSEFDEAINALYMNNLNNTALTCSKYQPESLDSQDVKNAQHLIKLIKSHIGQNEIQQFNKQELETSVRRWDTFVQYEKSDSNSAAFKKAIKFAQDAEGNINKEKAGQYLINSEIVETYPQCLEVIENPELIQKIIERDADHAVEYLCKFDDYKMLAPDDKNTLTKFIEFFDIKDLTDKIILKHIIENDYINTDTKSLVNMGENGGIISAAIASKAKQEILNKYKFPGCVEYFTAFENALKSIAGDKGSAGIKLTGRNNKSIEHRMELKIMGKDDRLYSSNNDYFFDIFSDRGMH